MGVRGWEKCKEVVDMHVIDVGLNNFPPQISRFKLITSLYRIM